MFHLHFAFCNLSWLFCALLILIICLFVQENASWSFSSILPQNLNTWLGCYTLFYWSSHIYLHESMTYLLSFCWFILKIFELFLGIVRASKFSHRTSLYGLPAFSYILLINMIIISTLSIPYIFVFILNRINPMWQNILKKNN